MISIMPAYGRKYETEDQVLEAWNANKDFKMVEGPYINRSDWIKYGNRMDYVVYRPFHVILENGVM